MSQRFTFGGSRKTMKKTKPKKSKKIMKNKYSKQIKGGSSRLITIDDQKERFKQKLERIKAESITILEDYDDNLSQTIIDNIYNYLIEIINENPPESLEHLTTLQDLARLFEENEISVVLKRNIVEIFNYHRSKIEELFSINNPNPDYDLISDEIYSQTDEGKEYGIIIDILDLDIFSKLNQIDKEVLINILVNTLDNETGWWDVYESRDYVQETRTYDYNLADKLIENIKNHSFDSNNFLNLTVGLPHLDVLKHFYK